MDASGQSQQITAMKPAQICAGFVLADVATIPHLKIEMWGTHSAAACKIVVWNHW
jgi:hypothetical protein